MSLTPEIWQGALVGVVFGAVNFWLLIRIVRGMMQSEKVKLWKTFLAFIAKLALLGLTIALLLKKGYVSPLPFVAGFTVSLIAGIAWKALRKSPEEF
jgi:hypothetical protein